MRRFFQRQLLPFLLLLPALVLVEMVLGYPIVLDRHVLPTAGPFGLLSHHVIWTASATTRSCSPADQFFDSLEQTIFFVLAPSGSQCSSAPGFALLMNL